ncbi:hypothetical protein BC940DRAFT_111866 [Gongronella butleri]|nr:hypothetical protein BC940DRAFT_111866 [Gongronella butleri]
MNLSWQQQAKQYQYNMDLQYQRQQEDIQQERESLASEKSELAFDLDFLKQASIELEEKMADAVHDEKEQKAELMEKMASIDGEIQDLMARIAKLKDQRQQYQQQVDDVDRRIEHALTTFLPDQQQHRIEHHDIERRKEKLQIQERQLDQRDAQFHQVRQRAQEMQAKEQQELKTMQEMMELAQTQAKTNGSHVATLTRLLDECIGIRDKSLVQALDEQQRLGKAIEQQQEKIRQARKEWWAMQERMEDSTATIEALQMKQTRLDRQIQRALQQGFYDVATSHQAEIKRINASLDERAQEKQEYQKQLNSQQQHIDTLQLTLGDMEHDNDQQWQQTRE